MTSEARSEKWYNSRLLTWGHCLDIQEVWGFHLLRKPKRILKKHVESYWEYMQRIDAKLALSYLHPLLLQDQPWSAYDYMKSLSQDCPSEQFPSSCPQMSWERNGDCFKILLRYCYAVIDNQGTEHRIPLLGSSNLERNLCLNTIHKLHK